MLSHFLEYIDRHGFKVRVLEHIPAFTGREAGIHPGKGNPSQVAHIGIHSAMHSYLGAI